MSKVVVRNEKFIKAFGLRVKELRNKKGVSQRGLSYDTDISQSQIQRIEKGEINTSISVIYNIAKALNVKFTDLVDFELDDSKDDKEESIVLK